MGEYTELMNDIYRDSKELSLEFEKSTLKFLLTGNAAAIGIILSFYKDTFSEPDAAYNFDISLWMFLASLVAVGFMYPVAAKLSSKNAMAASRMSLHYKQVLHKDNELKGNEILKNFEERGKEIEEFGKKLLLEIRPWRWLYRTLFLSASSLFLGSLIYSIWQVTNYVPS